MTSAHTAGSKSSAKVHRTDYTTEPRGLGYFLEKLERRLYRRVFEYEVLKDNFDEAVGQTSQETLFLLGVDPKTVAGLETKDHIEKACLIGLKAEFELFFFIYCHFVVDLLVRTAQREGRLPEKHKGLLGLVEDKKSYFEDLVRSGFRDARELMLSRAIPSYGLERMLTMLSKAGWPIEEELREEGSEAFTARLPADLGCSVRPLDQVRTAFQVRHAIEHSFSLVGKPFLAKAKAFWPHSTWQLQFADAGGPKIGDRIKVSREDILSTAAAMSYVAQFTISRWQPTPGSTTVD